MQVDTTPRILTSHTLPTNNKPLLHPGTIISTPKTTSPSHHMGTKLLHTQLMATSTNHNTRRTGMDNQHNSTLTLAIPNSTLTLLLAIPNTRVTHSTMLQPIISRRYTLPVTLGLGTQCIPRTPFNVTQDAMAVVKGLALAM